MTTDKKTIAIVCDKNPHTSFGRLTLDLRKVMSEEFNVHVVWLTTPKYFPNSSNITIDNSHSIHAPSLELGWRLFRSPFRKLLDGIKPDKVLLIRPELGFLISEVRRALPETWVGVMVHDMFAETLYRRSLKFKLINRYFIAPARTADGFLYNSEYTRTEAHKVMGLAPNHPVIGCPVDTSMFRPCKDKSKLRQKWGLSEYKGVCMNISLDESRKNIATFFKLAKERPEVAFVRVGPFSRWMKKWINNNKASNIIHHANISQDKLIELYRCADLFIYPSLLEGFGMPPLEALACGVPVAAASSSALKENLDGVTPLVSPSDNIEGYLKIIDDVMSGKNVTDWDAANKLLRRFSIEKFGERVLLCFRNGSIFNNNVKLKN